MARQLHTDIRPDIPAGVLAFTALDRDYIPLDPQSERDLERNGAPVNYAVTISDPAPPPTAPKLRLPLGPVGPHRFHQSNQLRAQSSLALAAIASQSQPEPPIDRQGLTRRDDDRVADAPAGFNPQPRTPGRSTLRALALTMGNSAPKPGPTRRHTAPHNMPLRHHLPLPARPANIAVYPTGKFTWGARSPRGYPDGPLG